MWSQDNYEIQVYGSETVPQGCTMFELHSNYTINGFKDTIDGVWPTDKAIHETVEITHGFTPWFEVGFYQFTAIDQGHGFAYVGNHIRPRVAVPQEWKWPVGASMSLEFGYQRKEYSSDTWTLEIRPIVDKQAGKWYFSFNPAMDYSFQGATHNQGLIFSPDFKFSYAIVPVLQIGLEYYNSLGPFSQFSGINQQPHQLALALDFNFSPVWELNIGYVKGLTAYVERDIFKVILGRQIGKPKQKESQPPTQ
ncbi:MAG TPA: hypothetical protein VNZ45_07910 [Bacteroidia bacterium]|nr:hypothetical protein [Bacteroidia bacterium]